MCGASCINGTFNLHRSGPFNCPWKDHDICVVENRMTSQRTYVDPEPVRRPADTAVTAL